MPSPAAAGQGQVEIDGSVGLIDLLVHINPATGAQIADLEKVLDDASKTVWDATDGHFRIREVTFVPDDDMSFVSADIRVMATSDSKTTGNLPGIGGNSHVQLGWQNAQSKMGYTLAHELGHYVLGLYDEYEMGGDLQCNSVPYGYCVPTDQVDHEHYCLMQSVQHHYDHDNDPATEEVEVAEFCVPANHDLDGQEDFCIAGVKSLRTQQTSYNGMSCWETIESLYPFVSRPTSLPQENPPPGYVQPTFIDSRDVATVLLLDRSGSMAWSTADDRGEVCDNGVDDDADGKVDEDGTVDVNDACTGTRLDFLKAGMRAYLDDAASDGAGNNQFGVVSFSGSVITDRPLATLSSSNLAALKSAIDALTPGGATAIGDGLVEAASALSAISDTYVKRVELFSDGVWNSGIDPIEVARDLRVEGVVVNTIAAGQAVDSYVLAAIALLTGGSQDGGGSLAFGLQSASALPGTVDDGGSRASYSFGRNPDNLVGSYLNRWARSSGGVSIIPEQPYHTNLPQSGSTVPLHEIPADAWFTGADGLNSIPDGAEINRMRFEIAPDTQSFTLVLAGNLSQMSRFAVSATLIAPDGSIRSLSNPGADAQFTHDPFYEMIRVSQPLAGEWTVEIQSASSDWPAQTGYLTVFARQPLQRLAIKLSKRLPSVSDQVEVVVEPIYVTTIRDLGTLGLRVTDPTGGVQSFPLVENADGIYQATISGLAFKGSHQVTVIAETDANSWRVTQTGPVAIPTLRMGASDAFFVIDGTDVSPVPRPEG